MHKRKQDVMDKEMEITSANHNACLQLVQKKPSGETDCEHVKQQAPDQMEVHGA